MEEGQREVRRQPFRHVGKMEVMFCWTLSVAMMDRDLVKRWSQWESVSGVNGSCYHGGEENCHGRWHFSAWDQWAEV